MNNVVKNSKTSPKKSVTAKQQAKSNLTKRKNPDWDNLDRGYRYLTQDMKLPHDQAVAVMGNVVEESQGDYNAVQKNGGRRGLIQWDGKNVPSGRYNQWGSIWASVAKPANVYDSTTDTVKNYWAPWGGLKGDKVRQRFIKAPIKEKARIYAESYVRSGKNSRIADRQLSAMQLDSIYNPKIKDIIVQKNGGMLDFLKNGSGIHIKEKNKGKFTSYCGGKVTDECIQKGKNSSNPAIRKRATFAANARKWKHQLGGNLLLGPMPSAINNPKVKNILSYMPFTGSAIDIETTMKNPSIKNSINAAISTGSDVLGGWLIRDVNKAKKAYNEAKAAEKTAKELLNQSRKSNVIARSVTEEQRRLKDNWEKAYWDLQLKDRQNFIQKYLDYPIYGGWLAGDATINYIQNQKKGGTLKFQEGGKTSWWNKAINFMNNSGLGEVALNALSTYTQNKQIGTSSDVAKAQVDKDKASRIQQANLAAEQEANDIQQNNVNPENPNAMSGDIVKNFIKNKLLSQKMALINQESDQEKAEIDWQTQQLKNQNTTNMWAGIGSTLI